MDEGLLIARNLSKEYHIGDRKIRVLDTISLSISAGEFVAVTGASGSGKSTLLSVLSGLDKPSSGSVTMAGREIANLSEDELAPLRNELIGFVFQSFHLIPSLNAIENVMFPAELKKDGRSRERAAELLGRVGLIDRRLSMVEQLSGGEKQRVALCRALVNRPQLVFADEPTGNLDTSNSREIMTLLRELQQENNAALVLATHSSRIAEQADKTIRLEDGKIVDGHS